VFQNGVRCRPPPPRWRKGGAGSETPFAASMGPNSGKGTHILHMGPGISRWDPDSRTGSLVVRKSSDGFGWFQVGYLGSAAFTTCAGLRHRFPAYLDRDGRQVWWRRRKKQATARDSFFNRHNGSERAFGYARGTMTKRSAPYNE
jgi:hypothetical protein